MPPFPWNVPRTIDVEIVSIVVNDARKKEFSVQWRDIKMQPQMVNHIVPVYKVIV